MLPHATQELFALGLEGALARVGVETKEAVFYNRFGQLIYREPLGLRAGYASPQFSLHRGDLQRVLLEACARRLGSDRIHMGWKCSHFSQSSGAITVHFVDPGAGDARPPQRASVVVGCDGLHSVIRKQLHPREGEPRSLAIETGAPVDELRDAAGPFADENAHGPLVAQPIPRGQGVGGVQPDLIVIGQRDRDPALRHVGVAVVSRVLGQQGHAEARGRRLDGGAQPGHTTAHNDDVLPCGRSVEVE